MKFRHILPAAAVSAALAVPAIAAEPDDDPNALTDAQTKAQSVTEDADPAAADVPAAPNDDDGTLTRAQTKARGLTKNADPKSEQIVMALDKDPRFSKMSRAVKEADLGDMLKTGAYTVLAPVDAAFETLGDGYEELFEPERRDDLREFVSGHIVRNEIPTRTIEERTVATTLDGRRVVIERDDDVYRVGDRAKIVQADTETEGGILHAIDTLLLPEDFEPDANVSIEE